MAGTTVSHLTVVVLIAVTAIFVMRWTFPPKIQPSLPIVDEGERDATNEDFKLQTVEIKTKKGRVQGVKEVIGESRVFFSFKGIPFAEPPVGELRFKDPIGAKPWSGVKGGQKPPPCSQLNLMALMFMNQTETIGQEDCLYLNVYTPKPSVSSDLPVMVYIHGGNFAFGDADVFGGQPRLLLTKDIVLVSIQYRLGFLGFLSTEDSTLPGNYGMKDQTLALRWVQENIRDFGGDPKRVTIFGQSAGSASVHLHILSPHSEGLFQQAILQSGTALSPFAIRDDHRKVAIRVGKILNCPLAEGLPDPINFLSCLQNVPVDKITSSLSSFIKWFMFPLLVSPRVDRDFIPDHPAKLLKDGRFLKVNLMAGITAHENGIYVIGVLKNKAARQGLTNDFDTVGPLICGLDTETSSSSLSKNIFYHYMNEVQISEDNAEELQELWSDSIFNIVHDESMLLHAKGASAYGTNVYAYEFEYVSQAPSPSAFGEITIGSHWVSHSHELKYLFDDVFNSPALEHSTDIFVSDVMLQLWTNFASTGNPTPDLSLGFKWLPVTIDSYQHLAIRPSPIMRDHKRSQRLEFWRKLPTKMNKLLHSEHFE